MAFQPEVAVTSVKGGVAQVVSKSVASERSAVCRVTLHDVQLDSNLSCVSIATRRIHCLEGLSRSYRPKPACLPPLGFRHSPYPQLRGTTQLHQRASFNDAAQLSSSASSKIRARPLRTTRAHEEFVNFVHFQEESFSHVKTL